MAIDAWIGKTLEGRYTVKRFIGRGGMGAVYEGEHVGLDRRVAIKFFTPRELSVDRERFRREAKLASRVQHENVAQIFDVGTTADGNEYIVMEYVEGRDLARVLRDEGALAPERAVAIARGMLLGLDAIHAQDIVHRDVKPSNVLVQKRSEREHVKIVDFGIARSAGDATLTRTGQVVGTAQFMAPEQFRGAQLDHRADLYAVGVTLFTMLAGRVPFDGTDAEIGAQHVFDAPPSLDRLRPGLPAPLVATVMRALAKAPEDRFEDALAFVAALDAKPVARAEPDTRSAPTVVDRPARPRQASRRARWPWLLAVATIVGGGVVGMVLAGRDDEPRKVVARAPADAAIVVVADAAPVPIDAAPAVVAEVANDASTAAGSAIAEKAVKPGQPGGQRCHCIPTHGPDVRPLCAEKGPSLCRCDDAKGQSVCPRQLIRCKREEEEEPEIRKAGRSYGEICDHTAGRPRCPDLQWDRYTTPGKQDEPCLGYRVYDRLTAPGPPDVLVQGHWNCDHCPNANPQSYRGAPGAPCKGIHWRSGQELAGTLKHCE